MGYVVSKDPGEPSFSRWVIIGVCARSLSPSQAKMPFDANKLYCSEILAILLQNNDSKCVSKWFVGSSSGPPRLHHAVLISSLSFPSPHFLSSLSSLFFSLSSFHGFICASLHLSVSATSALSSLQVLSSSSSSFLSWVSITFWCCLTFHVNLFSSPCSSSSPPNPPIHFLPPCLLADCLVRPFPPSPEPCKASGSCRTIRSFDRFSLMVQAILIFSGSRVSFSSSSAALPLFILSFLPFPYKIKSNKNRIFFPTQRKCVAINNVPYNTVTVLKANHKTTVRKVAITELFLMC